MKKIFVVLVILAIVGGCATVNGFLCSPTSDQTAAADTAYAMSQSILAGVASLTGNQVVTLLSVSAIPVFQKVIQGYCVAQADWSAAVTALQDAANQTSTKTFRAMPSSRVIADLQNVKW